MLPFIKVTPNSNLRPLVKAMREAAQKEHVREAPVYSTTVKEAVEKAAPQAEEILSDGKTRVLVLPTGLVTIILSIDNIPGSPASWHLSMSVPSEDPNKPPKRVSDNIARWLAAAFNTTSEGPSEGVFTNVRHFRGPYRPD